MTRTDEIAWAAGLFEGEGCISLVDKHGGRFYIVLELSSTDEDVVRRFHRIIACGAVTGPYSGKGDNRKDFFKWRSSAAKDIALATDLLLPLMCSRRAKTWNDALARQQTQRPRRKTGVPVGYRKTHCRRGHELSSGNVYDWPSGRRCRICWHRQRALARRR
jgi:hypothetical protein